VCEESSIRARNWLPSWPEGLELGHLRLPHDRPGRQPGGGLTPSHYRAKNRISGKSKRESPLILQFVRRS